MPSVRQLLEIVSDSKICFALSLWRQPLLAIIRSIASLMHPAAFICFCSDHCIRIEIMLRVDHTWRLTSVSLYYERFLGIPYTQSRFKVHLYYIFYLLSSSSQPPIVCTHYSKWTLLKNRVAHSATRLLSIRALYTPKTITIHPLYTLLRLVIISSSLDVLIFLLLLLLFCIVFYFNVTTY